MAIDTTIATKLAVKYAFKTGIEFEILYSEALEAYWRAAIDERYDPRKSAFSTYAYIVVNSHLLDVEYSHRRLSAYKHCSLVKIESLPSDDLPSDKVIFFSELLQQLPDDGKIVVDLVLNGMDGLPIYRVKSWIRKILRTEWSNGRIENAFQSVSLMLEQAEVF